MNPQVREGLVILILHFRDRLRFSTTAKFTPGFYAISRLIESHRLYCTNSSPRFRTRLSFVKTVMNLEFRNHLKLISHVCVPFDKVICRSTESAARDALLSGVFISISIIYYIIRRNRLYVTIWRKPKKLSSKLCKQRRACEYIVSQKYSQNTLRAIAGISAFRGNFRRDSHALVKLTVSRQRNFPSPERLGHNPEKIMYIVLYFATTFHLTFFSLLWQVRNYSLLELL